MKVEYDNQLIHPCIQMSVGIFLVEEKSDYITSILRQKEYWRIV